LDARAVDAGTPARARERLALTAAALVGVQVGAGIAASRWLVHDLGPLSLTFLRYAIALASLLPFLAGAGAALARLTRRETVVVMVLGMTQFGLLIVLLNIGLTHIDAGLGALLFATFPLLTMAIATLAGHERFDAALLVGVGLSVVGVALALGVRPPSVAAGDLAIGAACALAAALCGAVCSVSYRPLLRRHAMLPMGAVSMAAAVAALAPAAWAEGLTRNVQGLSSGQWAAVAAVGLSSGVAYWVWLWALKHTAPTKATAFLALSPVTAALIGTLALGETLGWGFAFGLACIGVGLVVTGTRRTVPIAT
jgi:drug/metabolite transporter (DMT)-like permease